MHNTNQQYYTNTTLCSTLGGSGWLEMDMQSSTKPYLVLFLPFLVTLLALSEQIWYLKKKSHLPGPSIILPFLGNAISLVRSPTKFWDEQASFAKSGPSGLSANFIFGRFILFLRSTELSHKVFANVRPDAFLLIGHPFGKKLFGQHNLIYLTGDPHKDLRRRIAPNFTPRALATYTALQQRILLRHLVRWSSSSPSATAPTPLALRLPCRDLNLETSQSVFVGPYLSKEERDSFNSDYNLFNVGLMALPIDLPGFAFREARLAVDRLVDKLAACARKSRARMARGEDPECLVDFWMQEELRDPATEASKLETDAHFGGYLFDFLFAAQDASTSSLLWAVALLDSNRDVLARVRDEVAGVWSPDSDDLITTDQLREMRYTEAVAREILRFRPPATLVPHVAAVDFPLTESYTVPKGTIVFPSVLESSLQGFTDPDRFDPDRFSADRLEDRVYKRNFLVFGTGAHQCVGQRYALNHLVLFLAMFTSLVDFRRHRTDGCDEMAYVPTICPRDDCSVFLSPRGARYPSFPPAETLK